MELSPKQQTVEQIKNAKSVLILGHKKPSGDMVGSGLALNTALKELGKKTQFVVSENVPQEFDFLPELNTVATKFDYTDGKLIRIDTTKVPVKGLKYQKNENYLDIYLDAEKNLKYEFIELKNNSDKPDVIIILDTPDTENIDAVYDQTPELFYEVPIINIDHHAGNEYFGTVNMVDLTATSTAEILVSLLEALQYKIAGADIATSLLTGIISDTQSFRSGSTTPKSLTVAAQLLASGGRQQEIVTNLYKKKPMALLKLWGELLAAVKEDKDHAFAWSVLDLYGRTDLPVTVEDVFGGSDDLLANTPEAQIIMIIVRDKEGNVKGKIKGAKGIDLSEIIKAFRAKGDKFSATFNLEAESIEDAELLALKIIHDSWTESGEEETRDVWSVMMTAEEATPAIEVKERKFIDETVAKEVAEPLRKKEDPIEHALKSLSENQVETKGFIPLKDIMAEKKKSLNITDEEIDVFDEEAE